MFASFQSGSMNQSNICLSIQSVSLSLLTKKPSLEVALTTLATFPRVTPCTLTHDLDVRTPCHAMGFSGGGTAPISPLLTSYRRLMGAL